MNEQRILTGDGVHLRAEASATGQVLQTCAKGLCVTVLASEGDWTKVQMADGLVGYLATAFLAALPASDYLSRVELQHVTPMFPGTLHGNIAANLPFVIAGLRLAGLADRSMLLMALGTIRAETASFRPIPEGISHYNTPPGGPPFALYDAGTPKGHKLGNTQPGDGARFKGRGFVQLTGRANYTHIGGQIGMDLVGSPDLACDGAAAGVILGRFLKNAERRIRADLAQGNLADAREAVNGGSHGLEDFKDAFHKGHASLPPEQVPATVVATPEAQSAAGVPTGTA
jgi:hypothetical protein